MKKFIPAGLAVLALFAGTIGLRAQTSYDIKGTVKGFRSGTVKLMRNNQDDRTQTMVATAPVNRGRFELKGKLEAPEMMTVVLEPGNWSFNILADKGTVTVSADTTGAEHYDYSSYGLDKGAMIKKIKETGSAAFDDWMKYQDDPGQKQFDAAFADLHQKFNAAGSDIDEQYRIRDKMDSVSALLHDWQLKKIKAYVDQNPSSVAGIYMFNQLYQMVSGTMSYAELNGMLNKFTGEAARTPVYKSLLASRVRLSAVQPGNIAPDFTLLRPDSSKFTLSETKGKYMLIDFWASWCHPCRQAIPHWKEVYARYHDKGFDMVSVSDDSKWADWVKAMAQEKMPWTQVIDEFPVKNMPARVGSLYMTTFIPFYVLLDREGHILVYSGDEAKIDQKLQELFGGPFTLSGRLSGSGADSVILYYPVDGKYRQEAHLVKNNEFVIKGTIGGPASARILFKKTGETISQREFWNRIKEIYLEPGEMVLTGDPSRLPSIRLIGSKAEAELEELEALTTPVREEIKPLEEAFLKEKDHEKAAVIHEQFGPYQERIKKITYAFFLNHPTSPVTLNMIQYYVSQMGLDSTKVVYAGLSAEQKASGAGKKLAEEIKKIEAGMPGSKAFAFTKTDINGSKLSLSDFKGRFVLLDFWASWCVPCRKGNPHMIEVYRKYKERGLEIIGIADDDNNLPVWKKAVAKDGVGIWRHVLRGLDRDKMMNDIPNPADLDQQYGISSIPTKILIDPEGNIIGRYGDSFGGSDADMDRMLEKVFKL